MKMKVVLDPGAKMPTRAHSTDAGYDLYTPVPFTVFNGDAAAIDTGVHVQIPEGYYGDIKAKSGLNVRSGITCTGVIDSGYTGSIVVKLYNCSHSLKRFNKGDKIAQLVITPFIAPELEEADSLEETERGGNGFGSSGR